MSTLAERRGTKGDLVIRRTNDWRHDGAPPLVQGMDLSMRASAPTEEAPNGTFEGWACVYGVQDSYGTTFQPGCFAAAGLDEGRAYPLLAMHDSLVPLGIFAAEERDQGLWVEGEYDPTLVAQDWRARAVSGSAPELSVGFVWLDDGGEDDPNSITSARLVETSQITLRMAAVPGAGFQGVRADQEAADRLELAKARGRVSALLDLRLAESYEMGE